VAHKNEIALFIFIIVVNGLQTLFGLIMKVIQIRPRSIKV